MENIDNDFDDSSQIELLSTDLKYNMVTRPTLFQKTSSNANPFKLAQLFFKEESFTSAKSFIMVTLNKV